MRAPGHPSVLQTIVSTRAGHVAPPFSGCSMTSRALVLVPPSQVALHSPHRFQSPTLQSTGNVKPWWKGKYLQPEVSVPGILAFENPKTFRKKSENYQEKVWTFQAKIWKFQNEKRFTKKSKKIRKKSELFVSEISPSRFSVMRSGGFGELATMYL